MRLVALAALEASAAAAVDAPTFMKNWYVAIGENGRMQKKRRQNYLAWRAAFRIAARHHGGQVGPTN